MNAPALLFDAGNTLLLMDVATIASKLTAFGWPVTADQVDRAEALARPKVSEFLASGHSTEGGDVRTVYAKAIVAGLPAAPAEADVAGAMSAWVELASTPEGGDQLWSRVPTGAFEALGALRDLGWRLGVVSNSDGRIERRLESAGYADCFDVVIDSAVVGVEKPSPEIWSIALERIGGAADRSVYVGDIYHVDVVGSRALGMRPVLVDPFDVQSEIECDRVPSVAGLPELLGPPVAG